MAGYHKGLQSTDDRLEVKRARKSWQCCGVALKRGARPDHLEDAWLLCRSRSCVNKIKQDDLYIGNQILPDPVIVLLKGSVARPVDWPTCLPCAVEFYGEHLQGLEKMKVMGPISKEEYDDMIKGLQEIIADFGPMPVLEKALAEQGA